MNGIVLVGGGGHALVVAEAARLARLDVLGFLDDDEAPALARREPGLRRLGALRDAASSPALPGPWVLALGDLSRRRAWLTAARSAAGPAVVHPRAIVSPTAALGPGTYVGPGAIVHAHARIGANAIINSGAIVEHECVVDDNAHVAPGAVLGGRVRVGPDSLVGLGARVAPNLGIGGGCVAAAGAVVIADVPSGQTVRGVPAR